jgi:hypothetical protein
MLPTYRTSGFSRTVVASLFVLFRSSPDVNIGKRVFFMISDTLSAKFTASYFLTTAVGNTVALPQRTLSNLLFQYNAMPNLRRTGLL